MVEDIRPVVHNSVVMGDKGVACAECSRSCLSLHRTMHDPYPIVSSFFKIMFGKLFSDLLLVPPKFAKTIIALEGKDTYLEDPTGQKWKVNLSNVNGSLTFQKGWHDFSVDHGIELGDMVVFHYFKGSHFIVQIFGKSGCEKPMIYSGMDYQNKRAKCNKESTPEKECLDTCMELEPNVDVHNVEIPPEVGVNVSKEEIINKQPLVLPSTDVLVESIFITDRDTNCASEDCRIIDLHDLSVFELSGNKTDADKMNMLTEYTCSEVPSALQKVPSEVALPDAVNFQMAETTNEILSLEMPGNKTDADKLSMLTDCTCSEVRSALHEISSEEALPDAVNIQMDETTNEISNEVDGSRKECVPVLNDTVSGAEKPLDVYMPLKAVTLPHKPEFSAPAASVEPPLDELRIIEPEPNSGKIICGLEAQIVSRDIEIVFTRKCHKIKKEGITYHSNSTDKNKGLMNLIVKQEAPEFCDFPTLDMKIACLVQQDSESFLELPKPLPVKLCKQGESLEQSMVVLQDPLRRLWPVIYHQRKGTWVLANGWREFRKANCIKPGDECTFTVKNTSEGIIQVQIVSHLAE